VHDITTNATEGPHRPAVYTSYLQQPDVYRGFNANMFGQMVFAMRGAGDWAHLIPAVRQAVSEVDPDHPISNPTAIVWWGGFVMINRGLYLMVFGTFAVVATLLAAMGIYGVTAYAVSQRTREIAIRMSVGARAGEIGLLLCRRAMLLIGIGVAAGVVGASMAAGVLRSQMWRMTTDDPPTFIVASVFLTLVALIATLIPARKATQVNPSIALRND
jgi:ABC-type antimicrobial peptide transport system permease subunit